MAHNLRVRCEEKAVSSAHLPGRIIGRGLLTEAVVVDVIVGKMGDHLPLYRQVERMKRACGFHPGLSTLSDVTMEVGSMLWLAVDAQKKNLLEGAYIQADEARMPVQSPRMPGRNHQTFLWQYSRPDGPVVFEFRMGREPAGPENLLRDYQGTRQSVRCCTMSGVSGAGEAVTCLCGCCARWR